MFAIYAIAVSELHMVGLHTACDLCVQWYQAETRKLVRNYVNKCNKYVQTYTSRDTHSNLHGTKLF